MNFHQFQNRPSAKQINRKLTGGVQRAHPSSFAWGGSLVFRLRIICAADSFVNAHLLSCTLRIHFEGFLVNRFRFPSGVLPLSHIPAVFWFSVGRIPSGSLALPISLVASLAGLSDYDFIQSPESCLTTNFNCFQQALTGRVFCESPVRLVCQGYPFFNRRGRHGGCVFSDSAGLSFFFGKKRHKQHSRSSASASSGPWVCFLFLFCFFWVPLLINTKKTKKQPII